MIAKPYATSEKPRCCKRIYYAPGMNFPRGRQCARSAVVERDGKQFCAIHDPVKVQERRNAKEIQWEAESKKRDAEHRLRADAPGALAECAEALKEAQRWAESSTCGDYALAKNALSNIAFATRAALAKAQAVLNPETKGTQ